MELLIARRWRKRKIKDGKRERERERERERDTGNRRYTLIIKLLTLTM